MTGSFPACDQLSRIDGRQIFPQKKNIKPPRKALRGNVYTLFVFIMLTCISCAESPSSKSSTSQRTSPLDEVEQLIESNTHPSPKENSRKYASSNSVENFKQSPQVLAQWPPTVNQRYPDLTLFNSRGQIVQLSRFRGKILLVEPIGMTCKACNAFSGGNRRGGFSGRRSQKGIKSIEEYLPTYGGGIKLSHPDLILVQIIFFNLGMKSPTTSDLKAWETHFGFDRNPNVYVLGASADMRKRSKKYIPGFYLVDSSFILRADSTGHHPTHNLYKQLIPAVKRLL
jgi:peroxiredoxin